MSIYIKKSNLNPPKAYKVNYLWMKVRFDCGNNNK